MHDIKQAAVDEVLASTFKQLTKSLMGHDNKAIESHSHALQSLLSLRQHLSDAESDESSH